MTTASIDGLIERFELDHTRGLTATRTASGIRLEMGQIHITWDVTPREFARLLRTYDRDAVDALGSPDGLSLVVSRLYEQLESSECSGRMVIRRKSLTFQPDKTA